MKILLCSIVIVMTLTNTGYLSAQNSQPEVKAVAVGGLQRYMDRLDQTVVYTDSAHIADVRGQLIAEFVVEKDGSLSSLRVVDSLGFGIGESVRQALLNAPPWHPAINNGIPVRTPYRLSVPINVRETVGRRSYPDDPSAVARIDVFPSFVQDTTIVDSVTLIAEPPGGMNAFMRWVMQNYRYPTRAADAGVSGTLIVQFVVELDGNLTGFKVLNDLGHGTGTEAVRLLKSSRRWKPGIANGKPVRSRFDLPIRLLAE